MPAPARDDAIRLADGRTLAYREAGVPDGRPVLYFHGNPGSRLDAWGEEGLAARRGTRLIAVDRPGIGRSDPSPGRRLLDWPADVSALADALELDRFAVIGYSAGGPYALACAHRLADRIQAVALLAAMGPLDGPEGVRVMGKPVFWRLARRAPSFMAGVYRLLGTLARRSPHRAQAAMQSGISSVEREVMRQPEVARRMTATLAEATRQGGKGLVDDMRVLLGPWGFRVQDIRTRVLLWQGDQDSFVRESVATYYEGSLTGSQVTRCPGEGHFLPQERIGEVLEALRPAA